MTWRRTQDLLGLDDIADKVSQDEFIALIDSMTAHSKTADLVLRLGALNVVLLMMRLIKQCALHPKLSFITETLAATAEPIVPFAVVFGMTWLVSVGNSRFGGT